jgi:hypothetical protein
MNKEQTPVQWLVEKLEIDMYQDLDDNTIKIIDQALEMEKERLESLKNFDVWKEWKNNPENK